MFSAFSAFWGSNFHHFREKKGKKHRHGPWPGFPTAEPKWQSFPKFSKCLSFCTPKSQMFHSNWRITLRGSFCTGRESTMDSSRKSVPNWTSHKRHHIKPIFCSANFMTGPDAGFCKRHTKSFRRFFCNAKCAQIVQSYRNEPRVKHHSSNSPKQGCICCMF